MVEVSEILSQIDIVEYMSQYLEFEEKGGEHWALSPFKDEHTPSFSVRQDTGIWYDFSSGSGGNLIDFVRRYHKMSVYDAVQHLKQYACIADDVDASGVVTRLEAAKIARKFKSKKKPPKQAACKVFAEDYMSRFDFDWDKLELWANEGIQWEVMRKFGVMYDPFDNRIVYPIRDYAGNIVSICGRTCDPDFKAKKIRKYTYYQSINTVDTLYAFSENREEILSKREIIIFEGAKSVMKAYGWGYRNCVALLTSHLNDNQLRFLIQLGSAHGIRMVFALDSDVDITKDENINRLCHYASVEWVRNRSRLLEDKDSPVDKGQTVFERLYAERGRL